MAFSRPTWLAPDLGLGRDNGILFWVHLIWGAGFTIQAAFWTIFIERLGATPFQIGLVVAGGAVVRTLLVIPAGILADKLPLKPVMLSMMAIPVLGALSLLFATEWWHALFGSVLMDMSGVAIPAASAYVATVAPAEQRARAMTYIFSMSWLASMVVMPTIGGWLIDISGFRALYLAGAALFAAGVLLALKINDVRRDAPDEEDESRDVSPLTVARSKPVLFVFGLHLFVPMLVAVGLVLMPNFMNTYRDISVATIGVLASVGAALAFGTGILVSHWRPLRRPLVAVAFILGLVGLACTLMLTFTAAPIVALAFMLRLCFSPVWSLMSAALADVTPKHMLGRAYGSAEFLVGIGDATAPVTAGRLYSADPRYPLIAGLTSAFGLAAAALFASRRLPSGTADSEE